jgi:DNA-directed RNA polymerase specialized sigma24 family protein
VSSPSVTQWLDQLRAGNPAAAQPLWERYFRRLVGLARKRLQDTPRGVADAEDVALSAFHSFCRGVEAGRFPQLHDRANLWHLLVVITARKAQRFAEHEGRLKRGGSARLEEGVNLDQLVGSEPTPEFAAMVAEECRRLFAALEDAELERVAQRKMEGYTTDEIAQELGYVSRTVERKLRLIRTVWSQELNP